MKLVKENKFFGNIKLSIIKKAIALGLVATTMFTFCSCGKSYKYITDPDTGIVSMEGAIPHEEVSQYYVLHYKDFLGEDQILVLELSKMGVGYRIYDTVMVAEILHTMEDNPKEAVKEVCKDYGDFVSAEKITKYLQALGQEKRAYTLEDLETLRNQIKEIKVNQESETKVLTK